MDRPATGLPVELAQAPLRTLRPRDVRIYTQPRVQIMRLERHGLLHRLTDGYYAVVPQDRVGTDWMPTLEGAAAGVAAADFGEDNYALMGLTAARLHRGLHRAIAFAVVAARRKRRDLMLADRTATIRFLPRDIEQLRVERMTTDMGRCLVTTPEQTVLDLAHLPKLGEMEFEVWNTIDLLMRRCDDAVLHEIATEQRLGAALRRVRVRAQMNGQA
jgi:hypothetical protein